MDRILRDALRHIESTVIQEKVIKHPDRPEATRCYSYPVTAIEECLCNAIYHRSYEIREPVEVRILPDSVTIGSFPGPDRSIRDEDIEAFRFLSRRYRNRRIGEFLKELDMTEGRGTGIPKIVRAVEANGSPMPIFHTDDERTFFLAEFPLHPEFVDDLSQIVSGANIRGSKQDGIRSDLVEDHDEVHEDHDEVHVLLGDIEKVILKACYKEEKSTPELLRTLGYGRRTGNFRRSIARLQDLALIEMTIPDRPRSKKQKYRLTAKGRNLDLKGKST